MNIYTNELDISTQTRNCKTMHSEVHNLRLIVLLSLSRIHLCQGDKNNNYTPLFSVAVAATTRGYEIFMTIDHLL